MSDGASVVHDRATNLFTDNAQGPLIEIAARTFANDKLLAIDGALTPLNVKGIGQGVPWKGYVGYGVCWHELYDGDIESYLRKTHPELIFSNQWCGDTLTKGVFLYSVMYDASMQDAVVEAWLSLDEYFNLDYVTLAMVDRQALSCLMA